MGSRNLHHSSSKTFKSGLLVALEYTGTEILGHQGMRDRSSQAQRLAVK
jgi:hypothetical protein